LSNSINSR